MRGVTAGEGGREGQGARKDGGGGTGVTALVWFLVITRAHRQLRRTGTRKGRHCALYSWVVGVVGVEQQDGDASVAGD